MAGIAIGEVTQINPQLDAKTMEFTVPVTVSIDPLRYGVRFLNAPAGEGRVAARKSLMDALISHGLRARLKLGSLVSGSLYVSLDEVPNAPPAGLDWTQNPVQLPTLSGKLEALEDDVAGLLKNINQAVTNADKLLVNANRLIETNSPLITNLNQTIVSARGTLTNADKLLQNASQFIEPNSVLEVELNNMLQQGGDAARSLRVLTDYLERHPEALLRGKTGEAKP